MGLTAWSWLFFSLYAVAMLVFGWIGGRRVKNADDFATARNAYGPVVLAFAFAATVASGGTFLGNPGLGYSYGTAAIGGFLYPLGVYLGVLISIKLIASVGHRFGNRSIPEYLGDRYQSDGIRLLVSIFSLLLFFYVAAQLVAGVVMFETMLGLQPVWALVITTGVLLAYVVLGGAHADILTDSVQGFMMLLVAILIIVLFLIGFGVNGALAGVIDRLRELDPNTVGLLNRGTPLYNSWWPVASIILAHIPLGLLPHLGNKLWALKKKEDRLRFVRFAFLIGLALGLMGVGGILARAVLGDVLLEPGRSPNEALPQLFTELFPTWLAALIGVGILAAIMSTADGLVVSSSQVIANDVFRRSIVPKFFPYWSEEKIDRRVLLISRWSTVLVLVVCLLMAWFMMDMNVTLLIWVGTGGMMAAFAGPLVVGSLWQGVTKAGAYAGLLSGMTTFLILHGGLLERARTISELTPASGVIEWLVAQAPSAFSCAAIGEGVSVAGTWTVSKMTRPLSPDHLSQIFPTADSRN